MKIPSLELWCPPSIVPLSKTQWAEQSFAGVWYRGGLVPIEAVGAGSRTAAGIPVLMWLLSSD